MTGMGWGRKIGVKESRTRGVLSTPGSTVIPTHVRRVASLNFPARTSLMGTSSSPSSVPSMAGPFGITGHNGERSEG